LVAPCACAPHGVSGGRRPTAYAIRSPFGSDERGVGCPRVVEGEAAQIASVCVSLGHGTGGG
jgi:hypothetical protein